MKIAHLINSMFTGGAENLITESISVFKNNGLLVDIILLNGTETPFLNKLKATNCNIIILSKSSVYNPFLIFKIIPILKNYDLIHVHLFPALYWVAIAKFISFSKIKLVFTEHTTTNTRLENKFYLLFDNFIYSFYKKIICLSPEIENTLLNKIPSTRNKTEIIQNGIVLNFDNDKTTLNLKELYTNATSQTKFIVQVAAFRLQKDQKTLIRSLNLIPSDFVLLLIGSGSEMESCKELVKSLNLQERVVFLGVRLDVNSILQIASIVVLSSHYEGLSLSSIEGMASRKPFIASDVPGLSEIVSGAGLLFPDNDHKALANYINKLNNNKEFYKQTVENCLKRAEEFDIEIMIKKEIELYKSVLS